MPFSRPSLAELVDRVRNDLRGRLQVTSPLLRRALVDVLAVVWAGVVHLLYGSLDWLSRQLSGKTAERAALLEKAAMYGITPIPATFATGSIVASGVSAGTVPLGTILRLDADTAYRINGAGVVAGGLATYPVIAATAGSAANIAAGVSLSFESPIAGVSAIATVAVGGITGGNDEEGTEQLRARYLLRLREPPEGGADQDYEEWALEVPGVTRAWVYPHENGLGTVVVRFVRDLDAGSIFPDAGEVAAVQAKLDAERPVTDEPTAVAPTNLAVPFTVLPVPNTAETQAAVSAELADLFTREGRPGDGAGAGTIYLAEIRTAIGSVVKNYTLTTPAADIVPALGQLPTLGVITWA